MHQRLQQHRHHHPPQPPVEDLRMHLNRMRDQRESDEAAGILPPDNSYIHNLPKYQRHAGYPSERKGAGKSPGHAEWEKGQIPNIKVKVSEAGQRLCEMNKDDVLKINPEINSPQGPLCSFIVKNENDPGIKRGRGRGGYRGNPRGRGYARGRGRAFSRGRGDGRRGRGRGKGAHSDSPSTSLKTTGEEGQGSEQAEGSEGSAEQHKEDELFEDDCNGAEYHDGEEYPEGDDVDAVKSEKNQVHPEEIECNNQETSEETYLENIETSMFEPAKVKIVPKDDEKASESREIKPVEKAATQPKKETPKITESEGEKPSQPIEHQNKKVDKTTVKSESSTATVERKENETFATESTANKSEAVEESSKGEATTVDCKSEKNN